MIQHYFLSAWIPDARQSHNYSTRMTASGYYIGGFTSPALVVDPGQRGVARAGFYAGPKDQYRLVTTRPLCSVRGREFVRRQAGAQGRGMPRPYGAARAMFAVGGLTPRMCGRRLRHPYNL